MSDEGGGLALPYIGGSRFGIPVSESNRLFLFPFSFFFLRPRILLEPGLTDKLLGLLQPVQDVVFLESPKSKKKSILKKI